MPIWLRLWLLHTRSLLNHDPLISEEYYNLEPAKEHLNYFDFHQMADFINHAANGRRVLVDHGVVQSAQA